MLKPLRYINRGLGRPRWACLVQQIPRGLQKVVAGEVIYRGIPRRLIVFYQLLCFPVKEKHFLIWADPKSQVQPDPRQPHPDQPTTDPKHD